MFGDVSQNVCCGEQAALRPGRGRKRGGNYRNRECETRTAMIGSVVTRQGRVLVPGRRCIVIVMVAVMLRAIGHSGD